MNQIERNNKIEKSKGFLKWQKSRKSDNRLLFYTSIVLIGLGLYTLSINDYQITLLSLIFLGLASFIVFKISTARVNLETYLEIKKEYEINKKGIKSQKQDASKTNLDVIKETNEAMASKLNMNIFKGKSRDEVKSHLSTLLIDSVGGIETSEKNIEIIKNTNYNNHEIVCLTELIKSNILFNNLDYINNIQSKIIQLEKSISERELNISEKWEATKNINYLKNLKKQAVIFSPGLDIVIFFENGKIKIVDICNNWKEISDYDIFDINFIFNYFKIRYQFPYFYKRCDEESLKRYELLNSDLNNYIDEYFKIIKVSGKDKLSEEYGFNFSGGIDNRNRFINSIKEFVFISNLFDAIIPIINSNTENSLAKFKIDSSNKLILAENDFDKLLRSNQNKISKIDVIYIHKFVKLSTYLSKKKENIEIFYNSIDRNNLKEIQARISFLTEQNQTYEMLLFHSINMIGSLLGGDLVSFYEIYEAFDKLNVFNSNWENEVSGQLSQISDNILELIDSIHKMEDSIVNELVSLKYVTQESFKDLNFNVTRQLMDVKSTINFNNLLNGIQTYQLYRINRNMKSIR